MAPIRAILSAIGTRSITVFEIMDRTDLDKDDALMHLRNLRDSGIVRMRRGLWKLDNDDIRKKKPAAHRRIDIPWQLDSDASAAIARHEPMAIEDIGDMLGVNKKTVIKALRSGLTKLRRVVMEAQ